MPREGMRRHSQTFIHAESTSRFAIAQVYSVPNSEIREANARLIAAAPDLYEEAKAIYEAADSWHRFHHGTDIECDDICKRLPTLKAAIEKAGAQ